MWCPSGEKAMEATRFVCPLNGSGMSSLSSSQTRIVWLSDDSVTVRRESDGGDLVGVSDERLGNEFARIRIPDPNCLIVRAGDDALPVKRESDGGDQAGVSLERL